MNLTPKERALILNRRHREKVAAAAPSKFAKRDFPKADRGRERDPGYLAFVRRLPCVAGLVEGGCSGRVEAAHIRFSDASLGRVNPGLQLKSSDRWATPLCRFHHQHDQHQRNERAFWERLRIEPGALSIALHAAYAAGQDGLPVLLAFTRKDAA